MATLLNLDPNAGVRTANPLRAPLDLPDSGGAFAGWDDPDSGLSMSFGASPPTWIEHERKAILTAATRGCTVAGLTVAGRDEGAIVAGLFVDTKSTRFAADRILFSFGDCDVLLRPPGHIVVRDRARAVEVASVDNETFWGKSRVVSASAPQAKDNDGTFNPYKGTETYIEFDLGPDGPLIYKSGDHIEITGYPAVASLGPHRVCGITDDGKVAITFPAAGVAAPTAAEITAGVEFLQYGRRDWFLASEQFTDQQARRQIAVMVTWSKAEDKTWIRCRDRVFTLDGCPIADAASGAGFTLGAPAGSAADSMPMRVHGLRVLDAVPTGEELIRLFVDFGLFVNRTNVECDRPFYFDTEEFPALGRNESGRAQFLFTVRDEDGNVIPGTEYHAKGDIDTPAPGHFMTNQNPIINITDPRFSVQFGSKAVPTQVERAVVTMEVYEPERAIEHGYAVQAPRSVDYGVVRTLEVRPPQGWQTVAKGTGHRAKTWYESFGRYTIFEFASGTHAQFDGYAVDIDTIGGDVVLHGPQDGSAVLSGGVKVNWQRALLRDLVWNYATGGRYVESGYPDSLPDGIAIDLAIRRCKFLGRANTYCINHAGGYFHMQQCLVENGDGYGAFLSPGTEWQGAGPEDGYMGPTSIVGCIFDPWQASEHDIRTLSRPHLRIAGNERPSDDVAGSKTTVSIRWILHGTCLSDYATRNKPTDMNAHAGLTNSDLSISRWLGTVIATSGSVGAIRHCVSRARIGFAGFAYNWGRKPGDGLMAVGCKAGATLRPFQDVASAEVAGRYLANADGNGGGIADGSTSAPAVALIEARDGFARLCASGYPIGGGMNYTRLTWRRRLVGQAGTEEDVPGWGSRVARVKHDGDYEYQTVATPTSYYGDPSEASRVYSGWARPEAGPLTHALRARSGIDAGTPAAGLARAVPGRLSDATPPQFASGSTWFAAWVYHDTLNNDGSENQIILHAYDAGAAVTNTHQIYRRRDGSQAYVLTCFDTVAGSSVIVDSLVVPVPGQWHFLFGVFDIANQVMSIRVDDNPIQSLPFTGAQSSSIDMLTIGASWNGSAFQNGMNGRVADLMFGRSAAGVADHDALADALYNGGAGIKVDELNPQQIADLGVTSAYPLSEGDGATRSDVVGTNNLDGSTANLAIGRLNPEPGYPISQWADEGGPYRFSQSSVPGMPIYRFEGGAYYAEFTAARSVAATNRVVLVGQGVTLKARVRLRSLPVATAPLFELDSPGGGRVALEVDPSGHVVSVFAPDGGATTTATSTSTIPVGSESVVALALDGQTLRATVVGQPGDGTATLPVAGGVVGAGGTATVGGGLDADLYELDVYGDGLSAARLEADLTTTVYTLSGPTEAAYGRRSGLFTLALIGADLGVPATITPADGGAGGSFDPAAVVLTDDAPSGTFAYRAPASGGPVAISTTNDAGLADPAPLSVALYDALVVADPSGSTTATVGPISAAGGTAPYGYQWERNDGPGWGDVDGETATTYTLTVASGSFARVRCRVTDAAGRATTSREYVVQPGVGGGSGAARPIPLPSNRSRTVGGINATPVNLLASSVGDAPVKVLGNVGNGRPYAVVQNVGNADVRLGGPDVDFADPTTGYLLPARGAGAPSEFPWPFGSALYAVCDAGQTTSLAGYDLR